MAERIAWVLAALSETDPPLKRVRTKSRRANVLRRISKDADVQSSAQFLKTVALSVTTMILAVCIVGAGACVVALVIHFIYVLLEAHSVEIPSWAHESEVQGTGAVIVLLLVLALVIVVKDVWRVGVQGETSDDKDKPESTK